MNNTELIQRFYESFAANDIQAMTDCYHENVEFEDPAFGKLKGKEVVNMWKMLSESSNGELKITFNSIETTHTGATANWKAIYVFPQTKRRVVNYVHASFIINEGKILSHTDTFNLWKWAKQALGFKGFVFGKMPFFKSKLQTETQKALQKYSAKLV